ncbi:MAG: hypothetical protein JWP91_3071, partial [Fibrobacteres bacterium]|nr:hypothetical protein [Fibrobacterota bacterium]
MSIRTISLSLSTIIAAAILIPASLLAARAAAQGAGDTSLGFFITSAGLGKGANLGGLAGADAQCQKLAAAAGAGKRTWRAYLSTQAVTGTPAVNARDRIGAGPWYNAKGVRVAMSVEDLHSADNKLSKENSLTEKGEVVKGRGDSPNQHDMLTGSKADGTAFPAGADMTCANWTSETTGSAMLGHHDRQGVVSNIDPASWNQAHASAGCSQSALVSTGGNGYFYCFAADGATALETGSAGYRLAGFTLSGAAFRYGGAEDIPIYILDVPAGRKAEVAVFSLTGTKLADLAPGTLPPGRHEIRWKGLHRG